MGFENSTDGGDYRSSRRRHEQRGKCAVIHAKLSRNGKRLTTAQTLCSREQDLFLHRDMLEQAGAKFSVSRCFNTTRASHSPLQQSVQTRVIVGQILVDFTGHRVSCSKPMDSV